MYFVRAASDSPIGGLPWNDGLAGQSMSSVLVAFITLEIVGGVLMSALVATFLITRSKRHPTLINLCLVFIITTIVMCLLFFTGQYRPEGPNPNICLAQATLAYAVAPMDSAAVLCLLHHVWTSVRQLHEDGPRRAPPPWLQTLALMIAPFVCLVVWGVAGVAVALSDPKNVSLSNGVVFYCTIGPSAYTTSTSIATALFLLTGMYFEVRIGIVMIRSMRARRRLGRGAATLDMQFVPRVFAFGVYLALGFILTILSIIRASLAPDVYAATVPVFFGVLFGSQPDVWRGWREVLTRAPPTAASAPAPAPPGKDIEAHPPSPPSPILFPTSTSKADPALLSPLRVPTSPDAPAPAPRAPSPSAESTVSTLV